MSTLQIVFLVLAASVSLLWLALAVARPRAIELPNVVAVLRYGVVLRCLALSFALAPPLIMIYVIAVFPWKTDMMLAIAGVSFLATSVIAGLLLIETTRVQIVLTEDGITRISPWTGKLTLRWNEIERIRYSAANRWFVIDGAGQTMRISRHLIGIGAFADIVRRQVPGPRWASAVIVFDALK